MLRLAILILCLSAFACNTDEMPRPQVEITALTLQNIGSFDFTEDIILLVDPTARYDLAIHTNPEDASVKFSRGEDKGFSSWNNFLDISAETGEITLIATKSHHRQSPPQRLLITDSAGQYLEDFTVRAGPLKNSLHLQVDNKTRGVLHLNVFSLYGHRLMDKSILKQQDSLHYKVDVSAHGPGIYLMQVHMGSGDKVFRLTIES